MTPIIYIILSYIHYIWFWPYTLNYIILSHIHHIWFWPTLNMRVADDKDCGDINIKLLCCSHCTTAHGSHCTLNIMEICATNAHQACITYHIPKLEPINCLPALLQAAWTHVLATSVISPFRWGNYVRNQGGLLVVGTSLQVGA